MRSRGCGAKGPHFIRVTVNSADRTIEVLDNGVGITKDRIGDVLPQAAVIRMVKRRLKSEKKG